MGRLPFDSFQAELRMAQRIEGGPERLGVVGELAKAQEALARAGDKENKYSFLWKTFGKCDDGTDPLEGWDDANLEEVLRCTLGNADIFAIEYDEMSEAERGYLLPDPTVAELVAVWAEHGRNLLIGE